MAKLKMNSTREAFLNALEKSKYSKERCKQFLRHSDIKNICFDAGIKFPFWYLKEFEVKRNCFKNITTDSDWRNLFDWKNEDKPTKAERTARKPYTKKNKVFVTQVKENLAEVTEVFNSPNMDMNSDKLNLIPLSDSNYVAFGNYENLNRIVEAKIFYPVFITGLSGNGKTLMVQEICANLKREFIRVNIISETDEDDLIGGFRLLDGNMVWEDGPVVKAMKRGAVLLLDEIDLGSNKIMCLQPILEGNGIYIKKTNTMVQAMPGFQIIATANTKGKGSESGQFIGTNIMNEAFLERFAICMEQSYPVPAIERKILNNYAKSLGIRDTYFPKNLVDWASSIRKSYLDGSISEVISTRRLVHIIKAYSVFGTKMTALELCINRFDDAVKESFIDYYRAIDEHYNKTFDEIVEIENEKKRLAEEAKQNVSKIEENQGNKSEDVSNIPDDELLPF